MAQEYAANVLTEKQKSIQLIKEHYEQQMAAQSSKIQLDRWTESVAAKEKAEGLLMEFKQISFCFSYM